MRKTKEYTLVFAVGAFLYGLIETLYRGYTHWTMIITGGFCFLGMYIINTFLRAKSLLKKCICCTVFITLTEFIAGLILNKLLNMGIWDYSSRKFNLCGQICLLFSIIWFILSIPGLSLCSLIRKKCIKKMKL